MAGVNWCWNADCVWCKQLRRVSLCLSLHGPEFPVIAVFCYCIAHFSVCYCAHKHQVPIPETDTLTAAFWFWLSWSETTLKWNSTLWEFTQVQVYIYQDVYFLYHVWTTNKNMIVVQIWSKPDQPEKQILFLLVTWESFRNLRITLLTHMARVLTSADSSLLPLAS